MTMEYKNTKDLNVLIDYYKDLSEHYRKENDNLREKLDRIGSILSNSDDKTECSINDIISSVLFEILGGYGR